MFYFFIPEDMKESKCINEILQYLKKKKNFLSLNKHLSFKTLLSLVSIHYFYATIIVI